MKLLMLPVVTAAIICGCVDDSEEELNWAKKQAEASQQQTRNTQQHVQQAQQQALQAQQQVEKAQQDVQHAQRLRDIDRLKCEAHVKAATAQVATGWAVLLGFSVLLAISLLWLAREIRMRRILSHILLACKRRMEVRRG
jgi:hypothetical protein